MKSKFIYGLLRPKSGECFYVGQSVNPTARLQCLRSSRGFPKTSKLKIFRQVADSDGLRIEGQIIRAYKRIGQARFNSVINNNTDAKLIKEKEKRRMAKKKRGDVEIKSRLRLGTLHFVKSANERRRVLDIARIDELNVTTREQSGGGFAVIYMNARKL